MRKIDLLNKITKFPFSQGINQSQNMKKFFKQATFIKNQNPQHPLHKYVIKLDQRTMKTPYRHLLAVPDPILAFLITSEFNRQDKYLKTGEMPMLSLCRTAVDADIQGNIAEHLKSSIFEYLKTDTLTFYDDYYKKQYFQVSKPLVDKFAEEFGMNIEPSSSLMPPIVENTQKFYEWVNSLNNWQLIGMQTMTVWFKSTISAYALAHNYADLETIEFASTMEEVMQMKYNGEVDEKLMNLNQVKLMASSGLMVYQHGKHEKQ